MKLFLSLLTAILIWGCSSHEQAEGQKKLDIVVASKYPSIIDSLSLQNKYDITKWTLYCIYCDDTVKFRKNKNDATITFSELELEFARVEKKDDSVEINFYFYADSLRCDLESIEAFGNKFFTNGVLFIKDSLSFYTTPTTMKYFWEGGTRNRFFNPLQPEVIAFIKSNRDKLNPWFREEAKRRKIIE